MNARANPSAFSPEPCIEPGLPFTSARTVSLGVWYRYVRSTKARSIPGTSPSSRKTRKSVSLLMKPLEKTSEATTVPDGLGAPCAYKRNKAELDPPTVARNARCGPPTPIASKLAKAATCASNQGWSRTTPRAPMNPSSSAETNIAMRGVT